MDFVKVTEIIEDMVAVGEVGRLTRDGIRLSESVAVSIDLSAPGTYLIVERVVEIDGEIHSSNEPGQLLFDAVLPKHISIQELAGMTALEFLAVSVGVKEVTS
ncbi:hypothetical protein [Paenibacillus bouchesdurhonensis]|uniref:hypothetical protein n=1 Tax=Paenibacillus bouchesdurhonensis TaxID=1870990 RepID=UPI000DA5F2D9|nr:hypothetical protein [Paenibacillus bouchesdurhonensis]